MKRCDFCKNHLTGAEACSLCEFGEFFVPDEDK